MPSIKTSVFLLLFNFVILIHADNYSNGFVETLGIDAYISSSGIDCNEMLIPAVHKLRKVLETEFENVETFSTGIVSFIGTVLFEMNSECRFFYGNFYDFVHQYSGDKKALKEIIEKNREAFSSTIQNELSQATQEYYMARKYNAGSLHGQVMKILLGIGRTYRDTDGSWIDGVKYVDSSVEIDLALGDSWEEEEQRDEIVVHVHQQPLGMDAMELITDLTVTSLHGHRIMMEL